LIWQVSRLNQHAARFPGARTRRAVKAKNAFEFGAHLREYLPLLAEQSG
jgi:hypothetical protein